MSNLHKKSIVHSWYQFTIKYLNMKRKILLWVLSIFLFVSCATATKKIESGNYDAAITQLVKQLKGKKSKKSNSIMLLETAFHKANEADLRSIRAYKAEAQASNWEQILTIYNRIDNRQNKIEPLTPLTAKDGYLGRFNFVNIEEDKRLAKVQVADYYIEKAKSLIGKSKTSGEKIYARQAVDYLYKLDLLFRSYKDRDKLLSEAYMYGTEYTLIEMQNNTFQIIPFHVEDIILNMDVNDLQQTFKKYHTVAEKNRVYDQYIIANLRELNISPEREKTKVYEDVFEEEKEEVVKDGKGRILRDSAGKEIRRKVKTKYTATIEEVTQLKTVQISGQLEWLASKKNLASYSKPISVEAVFENNFAKITKGNIDKVSENCRKKINNRYLPFPDNNSMLIDAVEKLKVVMKESIRQR